MQGNVEAREADYWDKAALQFLDTDLRIDPAAVDEEGRFQLELLGDVAGKRILEVGCGSGDWAVRLALAGAEVWAVDISPESVAVTRRRAEVNNVSDRIHASVMSATEMTFDDGYFEVVHGTNIVHHMDAGPFGAEVARVLRADGQAIFGENSANNPLLMAARNNLCGRFGIPKWSSDDEYPLTRTNIRLFSAPFDHHKVYFPHFLFFHYFNAKFFKYRSSFVGWACSTLDRGIFRFLPFLRSWSYRQVLHCWQPRADSRS